MDTKSDIKNKSKHSHTHCERRETHPCVNKHFYVSFQNSDTLPSDSQTSVLALIYVVFNLSGLCSWSCHRMFCMVADSEVFAVFQFAVSCGTHISFKGTAVKVLQEKINTLHPECSFARYFKCKDYYYTPHHLTFPTSNNPGYRSGTHRDHNHLLITVIKSTLQSTYRVVCCLSCYTVLLKKKKRYKFSCNQTADQKNDVRIYQCKFQIS